MYTPRIGAFLIVLSVLFSNAKAQKQEFDMFLTGKKIGTLVTDKKVKGNIEVYTLNSSANAQILWKEIATVTSYRVVFIDGLLSESYFEHKENGEVEKYCKVSRNENGTYAIHHWKGGKYNLEGPSKLCLIKAVYYAEPYDGLKMFNEGWGEYTSVKKTGTGEYEFKAPDGNRNVYRYSGGKISEAEFHTSIVSIKVRPKTS